jgi:hypothetical protein
VVPVVADADTLFGATTRGLLIHLDYQGVIRLHWSPLILDEMSRALVDTGRKPDAESARRHEQLMRAALPQAGIATQQVQGIEVQQPDAFLLNQFRQDPAAFALAFAALRATLRSAPEPDRLLERLAADGQSLTAAALHDAWQQGAVRL